MQMELDRLFRLAIPFFYVTFDMFSLQFMSCYSVYVLFFIADAWFRTMSLFMDIDLLYYSLGKWFLIMFYSLKFRIL